MKLSLHRVALIALAAGAAVLPGSPAAAKGPAMTWDVEPKEPVAGVPATIVVRTFEWAEDGFEMEVDTSRPWSFFPESDLTEMLRAFPPQFAAGHTWYEAESGLRLGFRESSPAVYRANVVFPVAGTWHIAWVDSLITDGGLLEVRVRRAEQHSPIAPGMLPIDIDSPVDVGHLLGIGGAAGLVSWAVFLGVRRRRPGR